MGQLQCGKKLSMAALSRQLPLRDMLWTMLCFCSNADKRASACVTLVGVADRPNSRNGHRIDYYMMWYAPLSVQTRGCDDTF
jgi:hypothetical protein